MSERRQLHVILHGAIVYLAYLLGTVLAVALIIAGAAAALNRKSAGSR